MPSPKTTKLIRFGLLLLLLAAPYAVGSTTGLLEAVDLDWIRARVEAAGAWGMLAYLSIFCAAVVLWAPGMIFALAGVVIYGPWLGPPLALLGLALSSSIMVAVFRRVGGELLVEIERPLLRKALSRLHDRPIQSIALLRLFLAVNPPLNTALAMAGVGFRHNFLGTALGMAPACVVLAVAVEPIVRWVAGP